MAASVSALPAFDQKEQKFTYTSQSASMGYGMRSDLGQNQKEQRPGPEYNIARDAFSNTAPKVR
jgi:hypothetical protein